MGSCVGGGYSSATTMPDVKSSRYLTYLFKISRDIAVDAQQADKEQPS